MTTQSEKTDELDLAQLMDQIKKDAANRRVVAPDNGAPGFYRQLITHGFDVMLSPPSSAVPPLKMQPELEKREQYQLSDLLGYQDEAFVRNAYQVILKRDPDDAGLAEYLRQLRSGRYSKIDIATSLRFSPEGRNAKVSIAGLGNSSLLRKLYRVPVAGYLLRVAVAIVRLPVLITNFRQAEAHNAAQLERVANHVNEAVGQLSTEIREQTEHNQTYFETLPRQLNDLQSIVRMQFHSIISEQGKVTRIHDALNKGYMTLHAEMMKHAGEQTEVQQRQAAELQGLRTQLERQIEELVDRLQKFRMDIAQQETRLAHFLDKSPVASDVVQPVSGERDHLLDSMYFALEDTLRGTPEQVKETVQVYLPVLREAA